MFPILKTLVVVPFLLFPVATSAQGITGITLQQSNKLVLIEWKEPQHIQVEHYKVYLSSTSILQNNGRFDSLEHTPSTETSLVVADLPNRGFKDGDTLFATVIAVDTKGNDSPIAQEQHIVLGQQQSATPVVDISTSASVPTAKPPPAILPPKDISPPEDARNLILRKKLQDNGLYTVIAAWAPSLNTAGDLQAYHLYESANHGKSFAGPTALLGTVLSTTIANIPPGAFTLKLTALDRAGNQSQGIMDTIVLPTTGAAATVMLSAIGAALVAKRRIRH